MRKREKENFYKFQGKKRQRREWEHELLATRVPQVGLWRHISLTSCLNSGLLKSQCSELRAHPATCTATAPCLLPLRPWRTVILSTKLSLQHSSQIVWITVGETCLLDQFIWEEVWWRTSSWGNRLRMRRFPIPHPSPSPSAWFLWLLSCSLLTLHWPQMMHQGWAWAQDGLILTLYPQS